MICSLQEKVQYYDIATEKRADFDRAMAEFEKRKVIFSACHFSLVSLCHSYGIGKSIYQQFSNNKNKFLQETGDFEELDDDSDFDE